jgi:hypothetical protein
MYAFDARQAAEAQAYVAYHFYAMAVEAAARVDIGELHTGILLATTAMGAIETIQGSEYGLATRALCCEALERAGSPQWMEMRERGRSYVRKLIEMIRDAELRDMFRKRPYVSTLLGDTGEEAGASARALEQSPSEPPENVRPGDDRASLIEPGS